MPYRDNETVVSTDQSVIGSAKVASEDHLDLLVTNPDWGAGGKAELRIIPKTGLSAIASVRFLIEHSTNGSTWTELIGSRRYTNSELASGAIIRIPLPATNSRYVRGATNGATVTTIQAGTLDMDFVPIGS